MRIVMLGLTIGLVLVLAGVSAQAGLLDPADYLTNPSFSNPLDATSYVANPSFESPTLAQVTGTQPDGCNYQQALPTGWSGGWIETGDQNSNSLRHYRPHLSGLKSNGGHFWDLIDGDHGAALILRASPQFIPTSWIYQSLGTVGEDDIGLIFVAEIDSSNRYGWGSANYQAERQIGFRTGVSSGRNGEFGDMVSMGLDTATRQTGENDPWHTLVDWFQPTEEHLGQEIFLVFSAQDVTGTGYNGQYQFDNVRLWVVPEPGTMGLLLLGLFGLLFRRGRPHRR